MILSEEIGTKLKQDEKLLNEIAATHSGRYVYVLRDPRDKKVFYVGKGQGARVLAHMGVDQPGEKPVAKLARIDEIHGAGLSVDWEIISRNHPDDKSALLAEAAVMSALTASQNGPPLNDRRGDYTRDHGWVRQSELRALTAKPVEPGRAYPRVYVFPIQTGIAEREGANEALQWSWKMSERWRSQCQDAVAVGLSGGIARAVINMTGVEESGDRVGLVGKPADSNHEFLNTRWTTILDQARGYWQYGNWLVIEFDGKGQFRVKRGSGEDGWFTIAPLAEGGK